MATHKDIWKEAEIKEGINYYYQIGPLDIWVNRAGNEWQVAFDHDAGGEERLDKTEEAAVPINLTWYRWILDKSSTKLKITPIMPDRPVIVRAEVPVSIMPGQSAIFFVTIPVFLKITTGNQETVLCEEPTAFLSNTWFGEISQGELCYALKTTAKINSDHLKPHHYRAICPIEIKNECRTHLDFERLCLRVQYLNIHQGNTRLWSNISRVTYHVADQWSKISYDQKPHEYDGKKILVGKARSPQNKNLLFKTFDNLSSFKIV